MRSRSAIWRGRSITALPLRGIPGCHVGPPGQPLFVHQACDQFGRRLRTHHASGLAAPFRQQITAPGGRSRASQGRGECVQHRIGQILRGVRHGLDKKVAQAAGSPTGKTGVVVT